MSIPFYHRFLKFTGHRPPLNTLQAWRLEMPATSLYSRRRHVLMRELKNRVNHPGFDQLASLYHHTLPTTHLIPRLDAIQALAADHWDFRQGKMRYEVDFETIRPGESVIDLGDPKVQQIIMEVASSFGLTDSSPIGRDTYDGLVVPGGAGLSPFLRLKHALEQTGPSGNPIKFNWIALLGCDRIVTKDERAQVKFYAPKAKTEFELMVAATEKLLDVTLIRDANMRRVGYIYDRETQPHVRYYKDTSGTLILVFNAPIPAGEIKANTGHTYDFLRAASGPRLSKGKHILLSSTARHRAFQHVDAERLLCLPSGISLETIGFSKSYSVDGLASPAPATHPPKELLQEIKSYVDALVKLRHAISGGMRAKGPASQT